MKILVMGNICSGKSTLIKEIKKSIDIQCLQIDEFRMQFGDGTKQGELISKYNFLKAINSFNIQILEFVGIGSFAQHIFHKLKGKNEFILLIVLITPIDLCLNRVENRDSKIPFPFENNYYDLIHLIEKSLFTEVSKNLNNYSNYKLIKVNNSNIDELLKMKRRIIKEILKY